MCALSCVHACWGGTRGAPSSWRPPATRLCERRARLSCCDELAFGGPGLPIGPCRPPTGRLTPLPHAPPPGSTFSCRACCRSLAGSRPRATCSTSGRPTERRPRLERPPASDWARSAQASRRAPAAARRRRCAAHARPFSACDPLTSTCEGTQCKGGRTEAQGGGAFRHRAVAAGQAGGGQAGGGRRRGRRVRRSPLHPHRRRRAGRSSQMPALTPFGVRHSAF